MKTILLVDDEESVVDLLLSAIDDELPGNKVEVASDGLQAARMLLARKYDAIVLDINLPGKSGLAILREFIQRDQNIAGKTIIISGEVSPKSMTEIQALGVSAVYVKPFDLLVFTNQLQKILGGV